MEKNKYNLSSPKRSLITTRSINKQAKKLYQNGNVTQRKLISFLGRNVLSKKNSVLQTFLLAITFMCFTSVVTFHNRLRYRDSDDEGNPMNMNLVRDERIEPLIRTLEGTNNISKVNEMETPSIENALMKGTSNIENGKFYSKGYKLTNAVPVEEKSSRAATLQSRTTVGDKQMDEQPIAITSKKYDDNAVNENISSEGADSHSSIGVSVVIPTYKKHDNLVKAIASVLKQQYTNLEIIVADYSCLKETKDAIDKILGVGESIQHLQLCDNTTYAVGGNEAVKQTSSTSKYILFLHEDIVLSEPDSIRNMVQLAEAKTNAAAVGCKILDAGNRKVLEAGSILWENGSTVGFGRGWKNIKAPQFLYPKPVDYVSGICLMLEKSLLFEAYTGFDEKNFPYSWSDIDLQMHIQHELGSEVWLQPKAVGLYDDQGSRYGHGKESLDSKQAATEKFLKKWKTELQESHLKEPLDLDANAKEKELFMAGDLRARDPISANILYIDERPPNKAKGAGFGRSIDNLGMLADLGHRVTLVTFYTKNKGWCDKSCREKITELGVEYVISSKSKNDLFKSRIGYYDIVLVSRPTTLYHKYGILQDFYRQSPFSLIYDCEALWFHRDEMLTEIVETKNIQFPGYDKNSIGNVIDREAELAMVQVADTVITVSKREKNMLSTLLTAENVKTIGHFMEPGMKKQKDFSERSGILFLASFGNLMYYNGDAIWYFLKEIYPLVIEKSKNSSPIPLTIAGRGIPDELRAVVKENEAISPYIKFLESPPTVDHLFEESRIFIAPHLYGAGIQYKVRYKRPRLLCFSPLL